MLGTYIQRLRQEKKLSLTQLAEKTDISKSYLSHIERNIQTNPSIEVLMKIALALGVDIQTLLNPTKQATEPKNTSKLNVKDWSDLINTALEAGVINDKDIREIILALQIGKEKP
jgi:XRE family transcriptional regulator of biofilm formation